MKKRDLWVIWVAAFLLGIVAAARCEEPRIKAWLTEDGSNIITIHSRVWSETSPPDSVVFLKRNPTRTENYSQIYGWEFATANPVTFLDTANDSIGMASSSEIGHYLDMQLPYFAKLRVNDGGFVTVEATHNISHQAWQDPVVIDHTTPVITTNPSGTYQLAVTVETDVPSCIIVSFTIPSFSWAQFYGSDLIGPATEHVINVDTGTIAVGGDAEVSVTVTDGYWCLDRGYTGPYELATVSTTAAAGYTISVVSATWTTPWCPDDGIAKIQVITDVACGMKTQVRQLGTTDWITIADTSGYAGTLNHLEYFIPVESGACLLQYGKVFEGRVSFYYIDGVNMTPWYYTDNFDFE